MKKLTATLVLALAVALTACSAPAAEPAQPQIQPPAATAPSAEPSITAAPIAPQAAEAAPVEDSPSLAPGGYGDPAIDDPFLRTVKSKWRGTPPIDGDLVAAAKFACDALATGAIYEETGAVQFQEGDRDGELNNAMLSAYASLSYCEALAY